MFMIYAEEAHMAVQARFYVQRVTRYAGQWQEGWAAPAPQVEVGMYPVSGSRGEQNKAWASATPAGEIKLTVGNPDAANWFESMLGKDVSITFEERAD